MRRLARWWRQQRDRDNEWRERQWMLDAIREGRRLRLWAIAVAIVATPFAPGTTALAYGGVVGVLVAGHLAALLVENHGARHEHFPMVGILVVLVVGVLFATSFFLTSGPVVALFAFMVVVVFFAEAAGRTVGLLAAALALGLAALREVWLDPVDRIGAFTLLVYAPALVTLALMIDAVASRQLRAAAGIRRLHDALRALPPVPDLDRTLASVVRSAREAVNAHDAMVLLREGDHLRLAAPAEHPLQVSDAVVAEHTRRGLEGAVETPTSVSFVEARTVVVKDTLDDEQFARWSRLWAMHPPAARLRSLVSVPLSTGAETIGVLQVYFLEPGAPGRDEVALVEGYAEQAGLVIARAQAYEQQRRLSVSLREADRLKSEFLALVSHELRTPLTAAKGLVDTVISQWERLDERERRDLLGRASVNADQLNRLIGQLLDYSRVESGGVVFDPVPTVLADAVGEVVEALRPALQEHRVSVNVASGIRVVVDDEAFAHALANVLVNAAKFAPAGSRITIEARVPSVGGDRLAADEVEVRVSDEGPGVPASERERIFERFYRSPSQVTPRRGAGLGLAIARGYLEACGGRIEVGDGPGPGAVFLLTLPGTHAAAGLTPTEPGSKLDQPV